MVGLNNNETPDWSPSSSSSSSDLSNSTGMGCCLRLGYVSIPSHKGGQVD